MRRDVVAQPSAPENSPAQRHLGPFRSQKKGFAFHRLGAGLVARWVAETRPAMTAGEVASAMRSLPNYAPAACFSVGLLNRSSPRRSAASEVASFVAPPPPQTSRVVWWNWATWGHALGATDRGTPDRNR